MSIREAIEKAAAEIAETPAEPAALAVESEPEPDPLDPPTEWGVEEQVRFRELPREAQDFVLGRFEEERKFRSETEKIRAEHERLSALMTEERRRIAQANGMDEPKYIESAMSIVDWARKSPQDFLKWFIKQENIDPKTLFSPSASGNGQAAAEEDEWLDLKAKSTYEQTAKELADLKKQLGGFMGTYQSTVAAEANRQIEQFRSAVDEKGKPKYPYFDALRTTMGELVEFEASKGRYMSLEAAYDKAVRLNDSLASKAQGESRKAADDRRKVSQAAQKASSSISGSGPSGAPEVPGADRSKPWSERIAEIARHLEEG